MNTYTTITLADVREDMALILLCLVVLWGIIGHWVAHECGRKPDEGILLGALLGPFGVLLVALLPRPTRIPA